MTVVKSQLVFLNSKYATTYENSTYKSDVSFYLSKSIVRPKDATTTSLRVVMFSFPVTYTNIGSTNNTLIIDTTTYTIPVGYYTAETLETTLNTLLNDDNIEAIYSSLDNKFTIRNDDPLTEITLDGDSTCQKAIGFTAGDHTSVGGDLESDDVVNLTDTTYYAKKYDVLYIDIPTLSVDNLNVNTGQRCTAITSVPVTSDYNETEYYQNLNYTTTSVQDEIITNLRIRILGEDLSTLENFMDQDWTLTLEFSFSK